MSPGTAGMEDVEPTIPSHPDEGGTMEARFADLCKTGLSLDENMKRQAAMLFKEIKPFLSANMSAIGSGSPEEIEGLWLASVLFCVTRLGRGKAEVLEGVDGVNLCQILRASKLKVVDFFKELPQFSLKVGHILTGIYGSDWEKRLEWMELKENVVQLSLLSRYYNREYHKFFLPSDTSNSSDYYRFGWLLFLALRVHAFSRFKDLVTCTNGIVSIMAILILHVPVRLRKFRIQDPLLFVKISEKGVNIIASLCHIFDTSEVDLSITMEKLSNLIVDILKKKPCLSSKCKVENLDSINTEGLPYFEDLLEEKSLQSSLVILERDYDDVINIKGGLDECMFVNDDSLLGTGSLSGGAINISGTKRKFDAISSPVKTATSPFCPRSPASPINSNFSGNSKMAAATPVSTALTTAKWLRNVILPLPSKPSPDLELFLSSCDTDVTGNVTRRANIIMEAVFRSSSFVRERCMMDRIWAEQRKSEALKLYYRVLEAICRAESQILNANNLTSLLSNERFHRCMLACSAELVLATHKTITMMFPAVLERTGITAFDLSKVIECFVRHEVTLPRELKRHLNSLEERLLESMAWGKGSSMYNSLIVARPCLSVEINRLGLLAEPMPSLDAIAFHHTVSNGGLPPLPFQKSETSADQNGNTQSPKGPKGLCSEYMKVLIDRNSFTSPIKDHLLTFKNLKAKVPPLQSAFASPTQPNPAGGGETFAESGITVFFTKIVKLAAVRIRSLCERLQLSQQILERIYCLFQQILSQRTSLFFNRHIDQLILCSFYGVSKISQLTLTFKEILFNYRKQPHCKPQVFRSVFVNWPSTSRNGKTGQEHVDVVTFYNEIFVPSVKPLLVELNSVGGTEKNKKYTEGQEPGSPRLSPFPSLPDMSPKKVSASHNVYVSPLRQYKMDALLSPSSKSYYACVGESTHAFQSSSKDLTAINNRLNCGSGKKVRGKLNFDVVSDSLVAGSLDPQNGSSASFRQLLH